MTRWRRSFAALSRAAVLGLALNGCGGIGAVAAVGSIGAKLGQKSEDHALYVRDVPDGFPAAEAGLQEGDEILMIDGVYAKSLTAKEVTKRLRGPIGSKVALTVARGRRILHIDVKRGVMRAAATTEKPEEQKLEE